MKHHYIDHTSHQHQAKIAEPDSIVSRQSDADHLHSLAGRGVTSSNCAASDGTFLGKRRQHEAPSSCLAKAKAKPKQHRVSWQDEEREINLKLRRIAEKPFTIKKQPKEKRHTVHEDGRITMLVSSRYTTLEDVAFVENLSRELGITREALFLRLDYDFSDGEVLPEYRPRHDVTDSIRELKRDDGRAAYTTGDDEFI